MMRARNADEQLDESTS